MAGRQQLDALTPEQLAIRAQRGSLEAFGRLVELFEARLFNFLLRRVGSRVDAEDLTQETFLRAWRRIRSYRSRWHFSTWLYTIATRLSISHARGRRQPGGLDEEAILDGRGGVEAAEVAPSGIWALVDEVLTPEQREAVWLRYVEALSISDIGTVMDKSQVAVRVMLFRARGILAEHLGAAATEREKEVPATVVRAGSIRTAAGGVR